MQPAQLPVPLAHCPPPQLLTPLVGATHLMTMRPTIFDGETNVADRINF
jgi:hypothetical protein